MISGAFAGAGTGPSVHHHVGSGASSRTRLVLLVLSAAVLMVAGSSSRAEAGEVVQPSSTVWLCKPGIADNPCLAGSLGGTRYGSGGGTEDLEYRAASSPPIDCFYVYPTQSRQSGPNADYSRDSELKAVAINQAAQFSRICRVFAPVYPQYTLEALSGPISDSVRDTAYFGLRAAFSDFLAKHSKGRGFVLMGHSQGASHLSRLIDEVIDPDPVLRRQMISAIVPGSNNIYVPKGEVIGGNLANIPACTRGDQLGCVMAWSIYLDKAEEGLPLDSSFGRLGTGYWVYPEDRPDPDTYEVLCVNPAELSGDGGELTPLANLSAFGGSPGGANPWLEFPGFYRGTCERGEDASWLDMTPIDDRESPTLDGILRIINARAGGLHTGDVNLVLGNLIEIASRQGARYLTWREAVGRARTVAGRAKTKKVAARRLAASQRRSASACRAGGKPSDCRKVGKLGRGVNKARAASRRLSARAATLARQAEEIYSPNDPCQVFNRQERQVAAGSRPAPLVC